MFANFINVFKYKVYVRRNFNGRESLGGLHEARANDDVRSTPFDLLSNPRVRTNLFYVLCHPAHSKLVSRKLQSGKLVD